MTMTDKATLLELAALVWLIGLCATAFIIGLFFDPDDLPGWGEVRVSVFWPIYVSLVIGVWIKAVALIGAVTVKRIYSRLRAIANKEQTT